MQAGVFKIRRQFRFELDCYRRQAGFIQNAVIDMILKLTSRLRAEVVTDADPVNLL